MHNRLRHSAVLVEGDLVHHTYKGRLWKALYTQNTFVDTDDSRLMYTSLSEFANSHLAVKTGVNGLAVCRVEREGKLVTVKALLARIVGTSKEGVENEEGSVAAGGAPKKRLTLGTMRKAASASPKSNIAAAPVPAAATVATTAAASSKITRKSPGGQRKAVATVLHIPATPPTVLRPKFIESEDPPYDVFDIKVIKVMKFSNSEVEYFKEVDGSAVYGVNRGGFLGDHVGYYNEQLGKVVAATATTKK